MCSATSPDIHLVKTRYVIGIPSVIFATDLVQPVRKIAFEDPDLSKGYG